MQQTSYLRRINLVVASQGAAQVVLLTQIPLISEHCGLDLASIGSLVALGTLCLMLAGPLWGVLGDRYGRKPVLLAGLAGALLAQGLFIALLLLMAKGLLESTASLVLLGLSRVIYGLSAAGIYPGCQAWAVEMSSAERRLAILSALSAAANLGRGLGPLLVLPALAVGGLWPLAWLVLLPFLSLALVPGIPATCASAGEKSPGPALNLHLCALFAAALLSTATIGQLQVAMGPVLMDIYGMSAVRASSVTALLLAAVAVCGFLVQWGLVRRLQAPRLGLLLGTLLLTGGTALLSLTLGGGAAPLGLLVFVAGVAFLVPGYSALLSEGVEQQGRLFGLLSLMHTGGYTLGFALGGWIYILAPAQPLLGMPVCAGLVATAALTALRSDWRSPRAEEIFS